MWMRLFVSHHVIAWVTPLLKSLMRSKSRIGQNRWDRLREINRRINEVISENRRNLLQALVGAREWWKHVDGLSQRRCSSAKVTLDMQSLADVIILLNCVGTVRVNSLYLPKLRVEFKFLRFQKDRYGTACSTLRKLPLDQNSYRSGCGETTQNFLHLKIARSGTCPRGSVPGPHRGKELM